MPRAAVAKLIRGVLVGPDEIPRGQQQRHGGAAQDGDEDVVYVSEPLGEDWRGADGLSWLSAWWPPSAEMCAARRKM